MRSAVLAAIVAAVVTSAIPQTPDLSGTWAYTKEAPPAGMTASPSAIMGAKFAIKQDAKTITISRVSRDVTMPVTYALDGTPTRYRASGRMCEGDAQSIESTAWDNGALAVTLTGIVSAGTTTERALNVKRSIRKHDADTLLVEASINQQGKMVPVVAVYKRTTEAMPAPLPAPDVNGAPATIAQLAWLPGFWVRTSPPPATAPANTPPLVTEERWTPAASGGMLALARTTRGATLSSFEFLCISEKDGSLVYTAMPDGRTTPTFFTLTSITDTSATFENPKHDYPQLIRYTLKPDGTLETLISLSNGQRPVTVVLNKQ